MVEKQAPALIQAANLFHIFFAERKIKHIKVLLHAIFMRGFRNDNHVALNQEPKGRLGGRFAVFLSDSHQHGIGEAALFPFGKGTPGFVLHAIFFHIFMGNLLLLEHMGFHLLDGGRHLRELAEIDETVGIKIGNADGTQLSVLVRFFHRPVSAVVIAKRLMDQHEIDVVGFQLLQRLIDGRFGFFAAGVGHPHFGCDEQFRSRHTALLQRTANRLLVPIGLGGINGPISHGNGVQHASLTFLTAHLKDAVAQLRHFYTVI